MKNTSIGADMAARYHRQVVRFPEIGASVRVTYSYSYAMKGAVAHTVVHDDNTCPRIYFNASKPVSITAVVHEAVHAIVNILDYRGFDYSGTTGCDETIAYYVDYLVGKVLHYVQKLGLEIVI